jgi:hypothetical protein
VFLSTVTAIAQSDGGFEFRKVGISASFSGDQTDVLVPIWGAHHVIAPAVSVVHVGDAVTDFGAGLILRRNLHTEKAVPYIALRSGVLILTPKGGGDDIIDFIVGPAVGGEYFLDDHFSLSVEAQVNISFSDEHSYRFGNPDGTNVNTASVIMATFYF